MHNIQQIRFVFGIKSIGRIIPGRKNDLSLLNRYNQMLEIIPQFAGAIEVPGTIPIHRKKKYVCGTRIGGSRFVTLIPCGLPRNIQDGGMYGVVSYTQKN